MMEEVTSPEIKVSGFVFWIVPMLADAKQIQPALALLHLCKQP